MHVAAREHHEIGVCVLPDAARKAATFDMPVKGRMTSAPSTAQALAATCISTLMYLVSNSNFVGQPVGGLLQELCPEHLIRAVAVLGRPEQRKGSACMLEEHMHNPLGWSILCYGLTVRHAGNLVNGDEANHQDVSL